MGDEPMLAVGPESQAGRMLLVVAMCGVDPRPTSVLIDRKFHSGMLEYVRRLGPRMSCLMPRMPASDVRRAMDGIEVPLSELPYRIHLVSSTQMGVEDRRVVDRAVGEAALAYVGNSDWYNVIVADRCRAAGVPYVIVSEYTLRTELDIMRATTPSLLRRAVREVRLRRLHRRKLEMVAGAVEFHANGYPTYEELAVANPNRLLYFDTRALRSDVISETALDARLDAFRSRTPRLLYSGRYHPMKGALDVVKAGIELKRRGLDFRLDLYGTGPLKEQMVALVRDSGAQDEITVHDPVPYKPDLVEITRQADLFLGCHVQGDPSCTYLETFACGVPVVGYANEMWSPLCRASGAGRAVQVGDHVAVAAQAMDLLKDPVALRQASTAARRFALANTMETAWDDRAARLAALAGGEGGAVASP
jgi:glycosyltransferase involved in cell wall biosynthesis